MVSYWMFVIVHLAAGLQRTNFLNVVVEEKEEVWNFLFSCLVN